jgi:hypothetical protein
MWMLGLMIYDICHCYFTMKTYTVLMSKARTLNEEYYLITKRYMTIMFSCDAICYIVYFAGCVLQLGSSSNNITLGRCLTHSTLPYLAVHFFFIYLVLDNSKMMLFSKQLTQRKEEGKRRSFMHKVIKSGRSSIHTSQGPSDNAKSTGIAVPHKREVSSSLKGGVPTTKLTEPSYTNSEAEQSTSNPTVIMIPSS